MPKNGRLQINLSRKGREQLEYLKEKYRANSYNHTVRLVLEDMAEIKGLEPQVTILEGKKEGRNETKD